MKVKSPPARARVKEPKVVRVLQRSAPAFLILALGAAWLTSLPGLGGQPTLVWRGYETLLVRPGIAASGGLQRIVDSLGPGVVSELSARVRFWSFTGEDSIPVGLMDERIDPSDPRHDKVMDWLAAYFRSNGWSIAYVPSRGSAAVDFLKIAALLGAPRIGGWRLLEFDPLAFAICFFALLALSLRLAFPLGNEGRTRLALAGTGALLWMPFLLGGGAARLALALLLLAAWFPAVNVLIGLHGWDERLVGEVRKPLGRFLGAAAAGLVLLLVASGFSWSAVVAFAGPVAGSVFLIVAVALFWGRARRPRRRRQKFDPVPIVSPGARTAGVGPAGFLLVLIAVAALAGVAIARSAAVPTPLAVFGVRDFSWESLERLQREHRVRRLPDSADLVAHEAFQQSLAFGRPWGLPARDERVTVRQFLTNARTGTIVAGFRTVKVFDDAWLDSIIRRSGPGSIETMLAAQGRAVSVASRGQIRGLLRELPVAVLALFVFATWFGWEWGTSPLMKGVLLRFNDTARRSQTP